MKNGTKLIICLLIILIILFVAGYKYTAVLRAETITFDEEIYKLKVSTCAGTQNPCINTYYKDNEGAENWTEIINIYYEKTDNFHELAKKIKSSYDTAFWIETRSTYDMINYYTFFNDRSKKSYIDHVVAKVTTLENIEDGAISIQYTERTDITGVDKQVWRARMLSRAKRISKMMRDIKAPKLFTMKFKI